MYRMTEILNGTQDSDGISMVFLLSTLVLAPVFEELAFRHSLKDFQTNYLISLLAIILLIAISLLNKKMVGILLLFLAILYSINWFLLLHGRIQIALSSKAIYALSMIFFVLAHFVSMDTIYSGYWPIYTFYGIHMVVCAYYLSKIRLQKNTVHSIFLHFLYNLVPALVMLF